MPFTFASKDNNKPAALVIGAMNLDVLAIASAAAIPEDSNPGKVTTSAGGVGRNIAEGLSRLGIATTLISAVGEDDAGRQLLMHCKSAGINADSVIAVDGYNTPSYVSMHGADGALLYAISDMLLMDELNTNWLNDIAFHIRNADFCVIDTNLPESIIALIGANSDQSVLVADAVSVAKCHRLVKVLPQLSLLKVNRHEAQALTDCNAETPLQTLLEKTLSLGPESVLLTLGEQGAQLATRVNGELVTFKCSAPDVDIVSVNGAGDALMAGLLAAALHGYDTAEQLRWGTVAARYSLATQSACSQLLSTDVMR